MSRGRESPSRSARSANRQAHQNCVAKESLFTRVLFFSFLSFSFLFWKRSRITTGPIFMHLLLISSVMNISSSKARVETFVKPVADAPLPFPSHPRHRITLAISAGRIEYTEEFHVVRSTINLTHKPVVYI